MQGFHEVLQAQHLWTLSLSVCDIVNRNNKIKLTLFVNTTYKHYYL